MFKQIHPGEDDRTCTSAIPENTSLAPGRVMNLRPSFSTTAEREGAIFKAVVMRVSLLVTGTLLLAASLPAAKKVVSPNTSASNDQVDIIATIFMSPEEIAQKLGVDPGKGIALLQVRVVPKTNESVQISPDDFILLAHDDGERSKPFDPAQLAGQGTLVVSSATDKTKQSSGFGGFGGMIGGGSGSSPGNSKPTTLSTKMDTKNQGNDKLLEALKAKQFPQKDTKQPVEGYLYFPLDGKHKLKNMALLYRGPAGRLDLEFEH